MPLAHIFADYASRVNRDKGKKHRDTYKINVITKKKYTIYLSYYNKFLTNQE